MGIFSVTQKKLLCLFQTHCTEALFVTGLLDYCLHFCLLQKYQMYRNFSLNVHLDNIVCCLVSCGHPTDDVHDFLCLYFGPWFQ